MDKDKKLYQHVDEVVHYIWDPIGVCDEPDARDEYESYLPQIFSQIIKSSKKIETVEILTRITKDDIGLDPNLTQINKAVDLIYEYKERIL